MQALRFPEPGYSPPMRTLETDKTSAFWKPALPDPDDEAFAQLALEAKVGYMVTHNLRHFPIDRLPALKVTSPKEFLHILQTAKP